MARRQVADTVIDQRWAGRIEELLARNPNLLASSVYRLLVAEGFPASYPTLVRHLRSVSGPRRGRTSSVTVPIETAPGEEAQADWSDCCGSAATGWRRPACATPAARSTRPSPPG